MKHGEDGRDGDQIKKINLHAKTITLALTNIIYNIKEKNYASYFKKTLYIFFFKFKTHNVHQIFNHPHTLYIAHGETKYYLLSLFLILYFRLLYLLFMIK